MRKAAMLVTIGAGLGLGGCAIGLTPQGKPVLGLPVGSDGQLQAPDPVLDAVDGVSGLLPAPWGQVLGATGTGLAGLLLGRERGRHVGWDEREQAARPATPNPVGASRV